MRRKLLACCLSIVMVVSLLSFPVGAANTPSTETTESIPENVAEIIASYFVDDFRTAPDCTWTADTIVSDSVTMYDVDGSISAYSFELTTNGTDAGYVVISAYPDVESVILEFSDSAEPVYNSLSTEPSDAILYTGALNYFKETENGNVLTVDGATISKSSIATPLADSRDASFLPAQAQKLAPRDAVITDPIAWAKAYYGGNFTAVEWKNAFEDSCRFLRTSQFNTVNSVSYSNHCGPTAIANLIMLVGTYRNYAPVKNANVSNVFSQVAQYGLQKGYYSKASGTPTETSDKYIVGAFALFNISASATTKQVTYSNIKSAINGYNPLHIKVIGNSIYGDHSVMGYAYTRMQNERNISANFVKIADGWGSSGRYLPIHTLHGDTMDVVSIGRLG